MKFDLTNDEIAAKTNAAPASRSPETPNRPFPSVPNPAADLTRRARALRRALRQTNATDTNLKKQARQLNDLFLHLLLENPAGMDDAATLRLAMRAQWQFLQTLQAFETARAAQQKAKNS